MHMYASILLKAAFILKKQKTKQQQLDDPLKKLQEVGAVYVLQ